MPVAMGDQAGHEVRRDWAPAIGSSARGVDLGDADHVGVVETGAEILEQRGEPRVAMWLMHGDDARVLAVGHGLPRGLSGPAAISTGWWP